MFWNKQTKSAPSIDELFDRKIKQHQLKQRTLKACTDNTDYELWLRNFLLHNRNNDRLIRECANYRRQLIDLGIDDREAARQTLDKFRH